MEICVQAVAAQPFPVEVMVCAFHDFLDLGVLGHAAHNGKDLPGQHHAGSAGLESLHGLPVVVVIAVEPSLAIRPLNPFLAPDMPDQPMGFLGQVQRKGREGEAGALSADIVPAAGAVRLQGFLFFARVTVSFRSVAQQGPKFFQKFHMPGSGTIGKQADEGGKLQKVPSIGTGEGNAFPMLGRHIQGIVPICIPQPANIVFPYFIKCSKLLDEEVF